MALIECSECRRQVSDKAASCPGCGAPIAQTPASSIRVSHSSGPVKVERTGAAWEGAGFLLIVAAIFVGIAGRGIFGGILGAVGFIVFLVGRFK
jgi:hypothetical protein